MADNTNKTIFQRLTSILGRQGSVPDTMSTVSNMPSNTVLFSTNDKNEYMARLNQMRQEKLLARQWVKAGNEMKWEGRLFCNCKTQVEYFKKKQDIERQINSLNNALKNLKSIYIKDTYSFFAKHFLSQIDTMIDNLKKDRDDVENLIKEEENGRNKASNCSKKRP